MQLNSIPVAFVTVLGYIENGYKFYTYSFALREITRRLCKVNCRVSQKRLPFQIQVNALIQTTYCSQFERMEFHMIISSLGISHVDKIVCFHAFVVQKR